MRVGGGGVNTMNSEPSAASTARITHNPLSQCKALHFREPERWSAPDYDDSAWPAATVYTREQFGPKEAYTTIESLFTGGRFIWSRNLNIDNLVLLRKTVASPQR